MRKPLLVMALVAMQLLSWSGNAIYLCLCDGSACLDFGPDDCHCCPPAFDGAHEARHHNSCRPQPAHLAELEQPADDSCDCTHVQISPLSGPAVVDDSSATKVPNAATALLAWPIASLPERASANSPKRGAAPPPAARTQTQSSLTALSVMLRC
jgi:hypothetical protein